MAQKDTLVILTVGRLESMSIDELHTRAKLLGQWQTSIAAELDFVNHLLTTKLDAAHEARVQRGQELK